MGPMMSAPAVSIAPARRCAYAVLRRVFEQGAYAEKALHGESKELEPRDRAFAMRLAYGAVQRKGTLDHLIEQLAERDIARLDAPVLAALRLGLYELLYLGGSPDYAVVTDAVELSKARAKAGHGLVNAVLRRAAREGPDALLGALGDATPEQAAIMHSHPAWLARMWWQQLGPADARALMANDNEPSEVALRTNTLLSDPDVLARELGVATHRDEDLPEALVLEGPLDVHGSQLWQDGAFLAQSRGAMLVARVLAPRTGERVLDLCAAPGGKSTHLAALMGGGGEVVAVERNSRRAGTLARTAARLRAGNVRVEVADAALARSDGAVYDRVLVDPPCSGLGTLQARPDLRWRVSAETIAETSLTQAAILDAGARALRPGGVLVYSTCTISPTENERVIAAFLDSHPDFGLDDLAGERLKLGRRIADLRVATPPDETADVAARTLLTLPQRDRTAGFFIARMRRS
jgi:16S rRNA (cytosine967-C5)-methyltransferase